MADNRDEEHLDTPSNTQPEKSAGAITPGKDTDAITPTQAIENMEVHHHTHHEGKKNWKSYLWEFLMLFLAVFCGFLAEYQLEHVIEHNREEQYMQSLLTDLSADIAVLKDAYPKKQGRIDAVDSVFAFFIKNPNATVISGKLFKTIRRTGWDSRFTRSNITFNQLKNAGGMRLVRNKQVADSVLKYDLRCEQIQIYYDQYSIIAQTALRQVEKLINAQDLLPLYMANTTSGIVSNIPDSISIRIHPEHLNDLLNLMMQEKAYARQEINLYSGIQSHAEQLSRLIKNAYKIE